LASRIRESIFLTFGEAQLPQINSSSSPTEVHAWKSLPSVRTCYTNLFKPISGTGVTYINRILSRVWRNLRNAPKIQIAFGMSICEILLDPESDNIIMTEAILKNRIEINLVSFRNFVQIIMILNIKFYYYLLLFS